MKYYFDKLVDLALFVFRRKSWPRGVLSAGVALVIASVTGGIPLLAEIVFHLTFSPELIEPGTASFASRLPALVFALGAILVCVSLIAGFRDWRAETDRQYAIAIELRGLTNTPDEPLEDSDIFAGVRHKHSVIIDIRNPLDNKALLDPELAVQRVCSFLPDHFQSAVAGKQKYDTTVIFGGLASVPVTFLCGVRIPANVNTNSGGT